MRRSRKRRTLGSPLHTEAFEAIGTHWEIELYAVPTGISVASLLRRIHERIERFDKAYSRFRADSLVSAMARKPGVYTLPDDAQALFDLYREMYELTNGKVTPLIGQALSDAGYDAGYSLRPGAPRPAPRWEDVLDYAFPALTIRQPVLLDVGAAGKGYLVDIVGRMLEDAGVQAYIVDAGGDMRLRGAVPGSVGLEHPDSPGTVIGSVYIANASLCGSAVNRRAWAGYHHIMDPDDARPVGGTQAVWVTAESTMLADMLTTCLFFVPVRLLKKSYTFGYGRIDDDRQFTYSHGFDVRLYKE